MSAKTRSRLLWAAATDATFEHFRLDDGRRVLQGKCIHCGRKHVITSDGEPLTEATVEHVLARNHGGTDAVENLAVACAGCNSEKGVRHDWKRPDDPRLQQVVARLAARRRERMREPPAFLDMPPRPDPER